MKKPPCYLKAVVICHGKSEKQICDFIKSNLRIRIEPFSKHKGKNSIQITSVMKVLNKEQFKSFKNFTKEYTDVEICNKKFLSQDFKIFIIMDTDDCTEKQKQEFISKKMFVNHWAYEHIIPIYNIQNLEDVLVKSGIPFEKKGDDRKKEYIKIFPTDKKYITKDIIQIEDFCNNVKKVNKTNLEEFIQFCLDLSKKK